MTVDIIIPAYNAHETIDRTLASIAMQKLDDGDSLKVYVVDDHSPNGGYEDIAQYWARQMDIALVRRKENGGCGQARQTGIDVSEHQHIMFIDADDVLGSPFAVRTLLGEFKKGGCKMAMGLFVEETVNGTIVNHGENYIWMHGKMFYKPFIVDNNVRFNLTRGNEDVGFLSVLKHLTDEVVYVPQVVYIWENYHASTVRKDADGYAYDYGWRDFIENMAWAAEELRKRKVAEDKIADFTADVMARLYYQTCDAHRVFPEKDKENWAKLADFYKRACRKSVKRGISLTICLSTPQAISATAKRCGKCPA